MNSDSVQFWSLLVSIGFLMGYSFRVVVERILLHGKKNYGFEVLKEISAMVVIVGFGASLFASIINPAYQMPWQLIPLMGFVLGLVWQIKDPMNLVRSLIPNGNNKTIGKDETENN